jgi:hypothetical protein
MINSYYFGMKIEKYYTVGVSSREYLGKGFKFPAFGRRLWRGIQVSGVAGKRHGAWSKAHGFEDSIKPLFRFSTPCPMPCALCVKLPDT